MSNIISYPLELLLVISLLAHNFLQPTLPFIYFFFLFFLLFYFNQTKSKKGEDERYNSNLMVGEE